MSIHKLAIFDTLNRLVKATINAIKPTITFIAILKSWDTLEASSDNIVEFWDDEEFVDEDWEGFDDEFWGSHAPKFRMYPELQSAQVVVALVVVHFEQFEEIQSRIVSFINFWISPVTLLTSVII